MAVPKSYFIVLDPKGLTRSGKHLRRGHVFQAGTEGVHVQRWLAAGRIAEHADAQPAAAAPPPAGGVEQETCVRCGCTDDAACEDGCSWVDAQHTVCSVCVELLFEDEARPTEFPDRVLEVAAELILSDVRALVERRDVYIAALAYRRGGGDAQSPSGRGVELAGRTTEPTNNGGTRPLGQFDPGEVRAALRANLKRSVPGAQMMVELLDRVDRVVTAGVHEGKIDGRAALAILSEFSRQAERIDDELAAALFPVRIFGFLGGYLGCRPAPAALAELMASAGISALSTAPTATQSPALA